jgi:phage shock protein PspC (stress-responsive transcriptional regulator)
MPNANLLTRDDTVLGICEAIGEDFGFHANWLRIGLALLLFWNPMVAIGSYLGIGIIIAVSRLAVPSPRPAPAQIDAAPIDDEVNADWVSLAA